MHALDAGEGSQLFVESGVCMIDERFSPDRSSSITCSGVPSEWDDSDGVQPDTHVNIAKDPTISMNMYSGADDCTGYMNVEGMILQATGKCYAASGTSGITASCVRNDDSTISAVVIFC